MWIVGLVLACGSGGEARRAPPVHGVLHVAPATGVSFTLNAVQGDEGGAVWLTDRVGATPRELVIQAERDRRWWNACTGVERCFLTSPADRVRVVYLPSGTPSDEVEPAPVAVTLSQPRTDGAWWADETARLDASVSGRPGAAGVYLRDETEALPTWYRESTGGWGMRAEALRSTSVELPLEPGEPRTRRYAAVLAIPSLGWRVERGGASSALLTLDRSETELVELGRSWAWGDVHAHGDLSHDGCEDPESGCINDVTTVGLSFFDAAIDAGLDFAVMSDHAEWYRWSEDGDVDESILIWDRQQEAVALAAEAHPDFVPILGYEWTQGSTRPDTDGLWAGGHRTVFFEDTEVCEAARFSAIDRGESATYVKADDGSVLHGGTPHTSFNPLSLVEAMDRAREHCGLEGRVLFVPHHPAWAPPVPVDWNHYSNVPDAGYTPVVEIFSEHGASECTDPEAEYCDWRPKTDADYVPGGAFQNALAQGFELGVVAGTDCHDARPGTVDDAPSCTAIMNPETGEVWCQDYPGGLTGVMVQGEVDRSGIFDGIFERATAATSGPRIPVRAFVAGGGEVLGLPGASVEAAAAEYALVSVEDVLDSEWDRVAIDLIDPDGAIVRTADEPTLQTPLAVDPGDVLYVRLRLYGVGDDEGERIWLSPWFFQ